MQWLELLLGALAMFGSVLFFFWKLQSNQERIIESQASLSKQIERAGKHSQREHKELLDYIEKAETRHIEAHEKMTEKLTYVLAHHNAQKGRGE